MGRFHRHDDGTEHSHDHDHDHDHDHHHDHGHDDHHDHGHGDHSGYATGAERIEVLESIFTMRRLSRNGSIHVQFNLWTYT